MGKTICVIITSDYPYHNGETFFEDEAPYISSSFDEVMVLSLNADSSTEQTRAMPCNFTCFPISSRTKGLKKYLKYLTKGFFCSSGIRHSDFSIKHRLFDDYLLGKSRVEFNRFKKKLELDTIGKETCFLIYSYWFFDHALLAVRIKEFLIASGYCAIAISRAHGYDLYPERNKMKYLPFREYLLDSLDMVFPCSQNGVDYLTSNYPKYSNKVQLARLGTPDYGFINNSITDSHTIVTCCFLGSVKRMTFFAKSFCLLCEEDPKAKWICIGDGPDLSIVKKIIAEHGFMERVLFTGALKKKEVIDIYKRNEIALFCNVSESEGVPVSIMEAQSFGIPVLATDVGGTSEIVVPGVGEVFPLSTSEEEFIRIILKWFSFDLKRLEEIRRRVRLNWEKTSSATIQYREMCTYLKRII